MLEENTSNANELMAVFGHTEGIQSFKDSFKDSVDNVTVELKQ